MSKYAVRIIRGKLENNSYWIEADNPAQAIVKVIASKLDDITTLPYLEISADLLL